MNERVVVVGGTMAGALIGVAREIRTSMPEFRSLVRSRA